MARSAKDDAERDRRHAALYAPPSGTAPKHNPATPRPAAPPPGQGGMSAAQVSAMMAGMQAEDAQLTRRT